MAGRLRVGIAGVAMSLAGAALTSVASPSAQAATSARPHFRLTLHASDRAVAPQQTVQLSGRTNHTYQLQRVALQLKRHAHWRTTQRHVVVDYHYSFQFTPQHAGAYKLRVRTGRHGHRRAGHSHPVVIRVYTWRYLADATPSSGQWSHGQLAINGTTYDHTLYQSWGCGGQDCNSPTLSFSLRGRCLQVAGVAGLGDNSTADNYYDLQVLADGGKIFDSQPMPAGFDEVFSDGIKGVSTLTLATQRGIQNSGGVAYPGFGDIAVLCY